MALQIWLPLNGDVKNRGLIAGNFQQTTAPTFVDGKTGKALNVGGLKMTAAQTKQVLNNKEVSICFWAYLDAEDGDTVNRQMFFGNDTMSSLGGRQFSLFNYPNINTLHWYWQNYSNGTYSIVNYGTVEGAFKSREWTHVAVTYKNPIGKIYINGEERQTFTGTYNASSFEFDTQIIWSSPYHKLNDFRVYDECISVKEIKELAKGMVAHYKLNNPYSLPTTNLTDDTKLILGDTSSSSYNKCSMGSDAIGKYVDKPAGCVGWAGLRMSNVYVTAGVPYTWSIDIMPTKDIDISFDCNCSASNYEGNDAAYSNYGYKIGRLDGKGTKLEAYQWTRVFITSAANADATSPYFYSNFSGTHSQGVKYYYRNSLFEQSEYPTGYAMTSRQGLEEDVSGNGFDMVFGSTAPTRRKTTGGRYDHGFRFIGDCSCFLQRDYFSFLTNQITFNCWVYQTKATGSSAGNTAHPCQFIVSQGRDVTANGLGFNLISYNGAPGLWVGDSRMTTSTSIVNKGWKMLTGVLDGTQARFYIDKELVLEKTISNMHWDQSSYFFTIGKMSHGSSSPTAYFPFDGYIQDVRVYSTALSQEDITTLYEESAFVTNEHQLGCYEIQETTKDLGLKINEALQMKKFANGLEGYVQQNCQVTVTDEGLRIYRPPNITHNSSDSSTNTMYGGMRLYFHSTEQGMLTKGHSYILLWDVKGKTSQKPVTPQWSNNMGWGGGGLLPSPSNVTHKSIPHTEWQSSTYQTMYYCWTINDDVYKVCTSSYSGFVAGETYLSYKHFCFNFTYNNTGVLGTDLYIKNIRCYDVTNLVEQDITTEGILKCVAAREDITKDSADFWHSGECVATKIIEI